MIIEFWFQKNLCVEKVDTSGYCSKLNLESKDRVFNAEMKVEGMKFLT